MALDVLDGSRPAVAFLLGSMIISESPRYLISLANTSKRARSSRELVVMPIAGAAGRAKPRSERRPRLSDLIIPGTRRIAPVLWVEWVCCFPAIRWYQHYFLFREILWKAAGQLKMGSAH